MGFNTVLLISFLAVILVQALNRTAGAIASIVWCIGLTVYGVWMFKSGADIAFLGAGVELWHFLAFMAVAFSYNGWVLTRQLRARSR